MSQSGVLLYYLYAPCASAVAEVEHFMRDSCTALCLRGRVRVALDGVNATLGGSLEALRAHAEAVQAHPLLGKVAIDFKLAESERFLSALASEAQFNSLNVRRCQEVVSFGLGPSAQADLRLSGRRLAPTAFHEELQRGDCVLVDVRNVYETRVGAFAAPGLTVLAPHTRTFSDLPAWTDAHAHLLANKRVLMCCTGGVRCERASAYLRSKGAAFQDVSVLEGGIVRYLESFPDGGLWRGVNFVFDERGSTLNPQQQRVVLGRCAVCAAPHDDYGARARCPRCRLLLLLCDGCLGAPPPLCELCASRGVPGRPPVPRRLRILCLHGFRQSGSALAGRTAGLRRRLAAVADFIYIDAPHALPAHPLAPATRARRAWLLGDGGLDAQREGWEASLRTVRDALSTHAPIHGVFGMSQGAAVAAAMVAALAPTQPLFLWAVCGYVPPGCPPFQELALPSLHVFGADGADAHVPAGRSAQLAACFANAAVLRHAAGHILPADRASCARYSAFLEGLAPPPDADSFT